MDSTVKQMLESFRFSVENYSSSLGPSNEKLQEARTILDSLWEKAERGADIAAISMDADFGRIGELIGQLASEPVAPAADRVDAGGAASAGLAGEEGIPPASVPAAGYHLAWDAMDETAREKQRIYYQRIFQLEEEAENAVAFNTLLMEDGVLLNMSRDPLIRAAEDTLEQAKDAHSPTVDYQQKKVIETYGSVHTVTELEYEGTRLAEFSNVEHQWDAQYVEVMGLLPACAQAIEAFGPTDDNVAKLRNSHRFMAEFMGITWDDVFRDERYLLFWNEVFWPRVPSEKRAAYGVSSAEGWRDLLRKKFYDPFVKDEPAVESDPSRSVIRFWRREYPTERTLELLKDPPRPGVKTD